ncbi:MAG: hypothetical protein P8O76_06265 [Methylophilaceae bacterium]|nr:hypothetical protein [Methylophilaceae bacterium]
MTRKEFEEAKTLSAEIAKLLMDKNIAEDERQRLETLQAGLSGVLHRTWLPLGWGSRLIMLVLFLVGAIGFSQQSGYFLFAWILLPLFSPRLVGEFTYLLGRFT